MLSPSRTVPQYFDIEEAGQHLGIVKPLPGDPHPAKTHKRQIMRLYMMVHRRQIPHIHIGKRLFFEKKALDAWMRKNSVDTVR